MVAADKWVGRPSSKNITLTLGEKEINELIVTLVQYAGPPLYQSLLLCRA